MGKIHAGEASTPAMERREVLGAFGLALGGLAGCANTPRPTPQPPEEPVPSPEPLERETPTLAPLEITDFEPRDGPDGRLVVEVTVLNPTERFQRRVVRVTTEVADGTRSGSVRVGLDPRESVDRVVELRVDYETWTEDQNLDFAFEPA